MACRSACDTERTTCLLLPRPGHMQGWDDSSDPCSGWTGISCTAGIVTAL